MFQFKQVWVIYLFLNNYQIKDSLKALYIYNYSRSSSTLFYVFKHYILVKIITVGFFHYFVSFYGIINCFVVIIYIPVFWPEDDGRPSNVVGNK